MLRSRPGFRGLVGLSLSCALVLGSAAARADDVPISPEARTRFIAGVNLLKDPEAPRYEEAYREFKAAYASSPSYKILGNLGLCAMKLERDDEAINALEKYLQEGKDLNAAEVAQMRMDLATLKAGVSYVEIASNPPGAKIVDVRTPVRGERVINTYGPLTASTRIGIRQGSHVMTAKMDGYPDVTWELEAGTAGGKHVFAFTKAATAITPSLSPKPPPPTTTSRPVPVGFYLGLGATGLLAAGTAVTGVLALGKHSDFQTQNDGSDPATAQSTKSSGQTLNLVSDILLGGAVVAGGVSLVILLTRPTVTETASTRFFVPSDVRVSPLVGTRSGGLALDGRF